jgi:TonB family protein
MHLPHVRLLTALALAALFVGWETLAPEKIDLQPVNNPPRLRAPASAPLTTMPIPRFQTAPQYPLSLRRAGIQGEALVEFLVLPDGNVGEAAVLRATDVRFGNAAVECVKHWHFDPALVDGKPVTCRMQVPIEFTLQSG